MIRLLRAIGVAVLEHVAGRSCGICGERTHHIEAHYYVDHGDLAIGGSPDRVAWTEASSAGCSIPHLDANSTAGPTWEEDE